MDSNFWYRGTKAVDFRSIPGSAGVSQTQNPEQIEPAFDPRRRAA